MDQKKNLLAGASAFGITVVVGLIAASPLVSAPEKHDVPAIEKAAEKAADVHAEAAEITKEIKAEAAEDVKEVQAEAAEIVKEIKAEAAEKVKELQAEAAEVAKEIKAEAAEDVKEIQAEAAEITKEIKAEAAEEVKDVQAEAAEVAKEIKAEATEDVKAPEAKVAEEEKAPEAKAAEDVKAPEAKAAEEEKAPEAKAAEEEKAPEAKAAEEEKAPEAKAAEDVKAPEAKAAEEEKAPEAVAHAAPAAEHKAEDKAHAVHWGYAGKEGPEFWGDLAAKFEMCKLGKQQSPIDLNAENVEIKNVHIETKYKEVDLEILNNGHTVQFNVNNGSEMVANGKSFQLLQVHYHTPSEHVVSGEPYPMEAHFVHKAADGELAVLGLLYEVGKKDRTLEIVVDHTPMLPTGAAKQDVKINPANLLPKNLKLVNYMGSLTTPPCSEGVNWYVVNDVQKASLAQIAKMHKAMGDNARPAQADNKRLVIKPE